MVKDNVSTRRQEAEKDLRRRDACEILENGSIPNPSVELSLTSSCLLLNLSHRISNAAPCNQGISSWQCLQTQSCLCLQPAMIHVKVAESGETYKLDPSDNAYTVQHVFEALELNGRMQQANRTILFEDARVDPGGVIPITQPTGM